jgi:hypothetical protein
MRVELIDVVPDHIEFKRRGELAGVGDEGFESVLAATRFEDSAVLFDPAGGFPGLLEPESRGSGDAGDKRESDDDLHHVLLWWRQDHEMDHTKERGNTTRGHNILGHKGKCGGQACKQHISPCRMQRSIYLFFFGARTTRWITKERKKETIY